MKKNKYVDIFVREAEEHLQAMRRCMMALEKEGGSPQLFDELLRSAHTLKGSAKMVDLVELAGVAHRMEDLLKELQSGERPLDADQIDVLLVATDAIEALTAQAHSGGEIGVNVDPVMDALKSGSLQDRPEAAPAKPDYGGAERRRSVRASVERLDQLVNSMGEILLSRQVLAERQHHLDRLLQNMDGFLGRLRRAENYRQMKGLRDGLAEIARDLERDRLYLSQQTEEAYQQALGLRLMPLATITDDFTRSLRDLARSLGKEVNFVTRGQDVELDRTMLDAIKPMLLHILNNSVDHGIEEPQVRLAAGKPKAGQITLEAQYEGNFVQIHVRDDGQGMDPAKIRQAAVKRQMLSAEEAAALSDEEALYLVLKPGFSTREFITDVSGRGVGLDVVKANLDLVKGNLSLRSQPGSGTELLLRLPLSLAIFNGLVIECAGQLYVVPQHYVTEILRLTPEEVQEELGHEVVRYRQRSVPLVSLAQVFAEESADDLSGRRLTALLLNFREELLACLVTRIVGLQEVVVKELGGQLRSLDGFNGATILGDGMPALILSVADLFAHRQAGSQSQVLSRPAGAPAASRRARILVVDDSITTRTMEKNILETHGYEVTIAVSGFDALDKLANGRFDLMVSDVEMPGMTGFELTARVRQQEETQEMPVIIVTSLATDDHRRMGMEAGAQAYIVKGTFDQGTLLETVETLIG